MWQVAEAKNKFSELLSRAETEGPQRVARRGRTYVLLTEAEYARLGGRKEEPEMTLGDFILNGPSLEGLEFPRDRSEGREVDFG